MSVVLDEVQQFLRAAGAGFALRDRRSSETVVALACGVWAPLNGLRLPPGTGIAHQVITSGKAFVTADLGAEPSFTARNVVDPLPAAAACVPLVAHDENLGGLWANRNEAFSAADVRLLQAIADMAATALHRQTLHEETNRRLQRLAALRSIDLAITSSLDLRLTLSILLEQVMDQLDLDAAAVLLLEPQTQTLRYAAGRGFRTPTIERTTLRLGEGAAGAAALDRRTELLDAGMVRHSLAQSEGFVFSCIVPLIAKGAIKGVLEGHHRQPRQPDPEWVEFLETLAGQAAIAIDNATLFDSLQRSNVELSLAYDTTIEGWASALDLRDKDTQGHSARVTEMTLRLAREMGFTEAELVQMRRGALLHDIGKMGIPDAILLKPGPLTAEEWEVMRRHPALAHEMLSPIAYLGPALDIPFCHHEKWDGTGYPRGLKGDEIPLAARIFAVADVWDALRSDRPYRPAWPAEKVRRHIEEQAARHFDPAVVTLFLRLDAALTPPAVE
jgi:putative nucleotidyltransferase with HDIG domain